MFPWPVSFAPEALVKWSKWSQSSKETAWSSWKWWESIKMKENICGKRNVVVNILPAALPTLMCCMWNLHCIATGAFIVLFCTYFFTLTQKDKIVPVFFRGGLSWSDADTVETRWTLLMATTILCIPTFYTLLLFHPLAQTLIVALAALLVRSEKAQRRSPLHRCS